MAETVPAGAMDKARQDCTVRNQLKNLMFDVAVVQINDNQIVRSSVVSLPISDKSLRSFK